VTFSPDDDFVRFAVGRRAGPFFDARCHDFPSAIFSLVPDMALGRAAAIKARIKKLETRE
jgi:hypothetical protein